MDCFHHSFDWENNEGGIHQADVQGMSVILMRPLTSSVYQRLMAGAFPQIDVLGVGKLLLNYVLSDPYVDVALVDRREPRCVEINNAISDELASPIDMALLHDAEMWRLRTHNPRTRGVVDEPLRPWQPATDGDPCSSDHLFSAQFLSALRQRL